MLDDGTTKKKMILCVDDDENLLSALRRLLRPLQHHVLTAKSAEEAILLASNKRPDLVLMDLNMPGMDGFEAIKRLKASGVHDVPVVMLTGDSAPNDIMRGYSEGCVYYITKPFNNDYVINIVQYLIGDLSEEERLSLEQQL